MKDIPGYEGRYAALEDGTVWSYVRGRLLTLDVDKKTGYVRVKLDRKSESLPRVIALTFVPNPDNHPLVLHRNENQADNRAENLYWAARNECGWAKRAKELVTISVGDRFTTNLDGDVELLEYTHSKVVRVRFLATGNEYTTQAVNLRTGLIADRVERERKTAEKAARAEAERKEKSAKHCERMAGFAKAREDAKQAKQELKVASELLQKNRLVGKQYTDSLGMKFEVIAPAAKGVKSWTIRYPESGNIYNDVKEGWLVKGSCYDWHKNGVKEQYEERHKARATAAYEADRENRIAKASEYQKVHKDKTNIRNANRRARRLSAEGTHTLEETLELLQQQDCKCACCKDDLGSDKHLDHIMPLALGGSNWIENLQWLCQFCNLSKSDRHPDDWKVYSATPEFRQRKESRRVS